MPAAQLFEALASVSVSVAPTRRIDDGDDGGNDRACALFLLLLPRGRRYCSGALRRLERAPRGALREPPSQKAAHCAQCIERTALSLGLGLMCQALLTCTACLGWCTSGGIRDRVLMPHFCVYIFL